jgi:hypothetical protein
MRHAVAIALGAYILALALDAQPNPAAAPAPPSSLGEALSGNALVEYQNGRTLYAAGDFASALASFERAFSVTPDPRLLWNMAACERKLEHFVRVLELVDRYVRESGSMLSEQEREEAARVVTAVRGFVASVTISTQPEGAQVFVDDQAVGRTPLSAPVLVDPGPHRFRFVKAGYRQALRKESLGRGAELAIAVELVPETPAASTPRPEQGSPPIEPHPGPAEADAPSRMPPLLLAGAGLAVAATGAVLVALSSAKYSRLEQNCAPHCERDDWATWRSLETTGGVLLIGGGVALGAGLAWLFVLPDSRQQAWVRASGTSIAFGRQF